MKLVVTKVMPVLVRMVSDPLSRRGRGHQRKEDDTCIGTEMGQRKIPALVMWYLPVIDRLKRLFSNPNTAKLMMWHDDRPLKNDGMLRHPSDAHQWKTFDANHELFGEEKKVCTVRVEHRRDESIW